MYPISPAFAEAIATGYQSVIVANVLDQGQVVLAGLLISDGTITVSRTAAVRRTMSVTAVISNPEQIPADDTGALAPFGNELQVFASWIDPKTGQIHVLSNGTQELIPMGVFAMTDVVMTDTGQDLTMTITGSDRSWTVSQRAFKTPYAVAAGTAPETAIQAILNAQAPGLPALNMPPTGFALPAANFAEGADPFAACLTLATAAGNELFFDVNGVPTGLPIPNPANISPCWSYRTDGTGNAFPTSISRTLTRTGVSNDFIVSGTGSQNTPTGTGSTSGPVRAESEDNNAGSPTYVSGKFGDVPTFTTSSLVTTAATAQAAADNALTASLGAVELFTVTAAPSPMFDIDDVFVLSDPRLQVGCNAVCDAVSHVMRHDTDTSLSLRRVY